MRIPNADKTAVKETTVIFVYDDEFGITDNMRGLVSVCDICKFLGLRFKVNIVSPFKLTDFLLPNEYDWEITPQEFAAAVEENNSCKFSCLVNHPREVLNKIKTKCENRLYLTVKNNILTVSSYEYGQIYNELFQPTAELREALNSHLRQIGGDFVSAAFRFQQLLRDFVDNGDYPILKPEDGEILTLRCLEHLEEIHKENPEKKIFVTSDSYSFLSAAQKFDYVYLILEKIMHPNNPEAKNADKNVWMKYFLDYFLLTRSQKIYLVLDGLMYNSNIPRFAAMHGKIQYVTKDYRFMRETKILFGS